MKWETNLNRKQSSGSQQQEEVNSKEMREFWGDGTALYVECGGDYICWNTELFNKEGTFIVYKLYLNYSVELERLIPKLKWKNRPRITQTFLKKKRKKGVLAG